MQDVWANQSGGVFARLGGAGGGATYLGPVFRIVALLVGVAAAGQLAATREEEAEGYLDHLLARPVAWLSWLAGRLAVAAAVLAAAGVLTGLLTCLGAASSRADVRLATVLPARVNVVPAGLFVLGIGTMVHGLEPRFAVAVAYGLVAWSCRRHRRDRVRAPRPQGCLNAPAGCRHDPPAPCCRPC
jgi:ABC-2 type transport system permease protein